MKVKIHNLDMQAVGEIDLADAIFGAEVRTDLLARTVNWQLNKRRAGTHSTKTIAMVSGTTAKPFKQKGTGRARQGSLRSPQFRKGAVIFGPHPRSHETDLQKKVRVAALRAALSSKQATGKLVILENTATKDVKTKAMAVKLAKIGKSLLFIDGSNVDVNFALSVRNIPLVNVLPEQGANVYDILRHDTLVLTKNAVEQLAQRLAIKPKTEKKVKAAPAKAADGKRKAKKLASRAAAVAKPNVKKVASAKARAAAKKSEA